MTSHNCSNAITVIRHGQLISGCDFCIGSKIQPTDLAASSRRNQQRREYARDLVQPFEKNYAKARGADEAKAAGWSDASIRRHT